jgi:hypothetical protein
MSYQPDMPEMENLYEPTEPSTKNSSNINKTRKNERKYSTPKGNVIQSQKIVKDSSSENLVEKEKKFLAHTNGP